MTPRRTPLLLSVAPIAALALAGCGSTSSPSSPTSASTSTTAQATQTPPAGSGGAAAGAVALSADPGGALRFNLSTLHAKAGTVTVQMADPAGSGVGHGIAVQGNGVDKDSKIVQPGGTATLSLSLKPGTYTFYCPVPGHEAAGMKGTLIVT